MTRGPGVGFTCYGRAEKMSYDVQQIKQVAAGRWPEIISRRAVLMSNCWTDGITLV